MTSVAYTEKALSQLDELDQRAAERILNKVDEATEWTERRVNPLTGFPYDKSRAGDYRAIIA